MCIVNIYREVMRMNSGSAFSEFVQLCARRVVWLIGFVVAAFLVTFIYVFVTTPQQCVVKAQMRISSTQMAEGDSAARDKLELASILADDAINTIVNSDTIAIALQNSNLLTTYNPETFKNRVTAEKNGNSTVLMTVAYEGSWLDAEVFMESFINTCETTINEYYAEKGYDFKIDNSESGRTYDETPRAKPAFIWGLIIMAGVFVLFLLVQAVSLFTDRTLRSHHKFDKITDVPVIASIPSNTRVGNGEKTGQKISNAYQTLRSAVKYSDKKVRSIAVCSSTPRDGRSSVAVGLATSLAETDAMVLLIEADMRKPNISQLMKIESTFGIADLLLGKTNLAATICKTSNRNLYVITAVNNTNLSSINIADLLDSVVFDELLESVQGQFDYVIIDTPSVGLVADATSVIGKVDASIIVAQYGHTNIDSLKSAIDIVKALGSQILGVVTTNAQPHTSIFNSSSKYYRGGARGSKVSGLAAFFAKKN